MTEVLLNYLKLKNFPMKMVDKSNINVYIKTDDELTDICTFLFYKMHKFVNKVHRKEIFWTIIDQITFYFILPIKNKSEESIE